MTGYNRRQFLQGFVVTAAGVLLGGCERGKGPEEATVPPTASPLLAATVPSAAVAGVTATPVTPWQPPAASRVTSNDDFYTMKYHPTPPPEIDEATYRLEIDGEVNRPLSLSLAEIRALPAQEIMRTLECISNPVGGRLIGNAVWQGVAMGALLEMAEVRSSTHYLRLESLDGYHTGIPVSLAQKADSLLVYSMNGETLPAKHGYPLRALWPGRYGQKQPKWLNRVTVQRQPHIGHFEGQGWSDEAIILPNGRIEQPPPRVVQQPPFYVAGIGFTTDAGLEKVEVSVDDGKTWQEADLLPGPGPLVWTHWWLEVSALPAGAHRVLARVTDRLGQTQSRPERNNALLGDPFPNGTDEMHRVVIQVGSGT